jgi:hypothetical protein
MKGPYPKYTVTKNDGDTDPNADYFVLRLDKDEAARSAAWAYANYIEPDNPELARDLRKRVADHAEADLDNRGYL